MPITHLQSGSLRHRVAIQERLETQDTDTGDITYTWANVRAGFPDEWSSVPAAILPLNSREQIAAAAVQSEIVGHFLIRHRLGLNAKMRFVHKGLAFDIQPPIPDSDSGIEYFRVPFKQGVSLG